jgi:hypothetical protein
MEGNWKGQGAHKVRGCLELLDLAFEFSTRNNLRAGGKVRVVEHLPSKNETLSTNPSITRKEGGGGEEGETAQITTWKALSLTWRSKAAAQSTAITGHVLGRRKGL